MKSRTTESFRRLLADAPVEVRERAREAYRMFMSDPHHPGLRFKKVHPERPIYSARIDRDWRAVAVIDGDTAVWFWIGSHDAYALLLRRL